MLKQSYPARLTLRAVDPATGTSTDEVILEDAQTAAEVHYKVEEIMRTPAKLSEWKMMTWHRYIENMAFPTAVIPSAQEIRLGGQNPADQAVDPDGGPFDTYNYLFILESKQ